MAKNNTKETKSAEELLQDALIPEEEQLYKIPDNWVWTKLGLIGNYYNGRAFKPTDWKEKGLPIVRIQNLTGSSNVINYFDGEVKSENELNDGDFFISLIFI